MTADAKNTRRRGKRIALLVGMAGAMLALLLSQTHLFEGFEHRTLDSMIRTRGSQPLEAPIAVVAVDDTTVTDPDFGWPIDRTHYGLLTLILRQQGGARAVVYDILFPDPDPRDENNDVSFGRLIAASGKTGLAVELKAAADEHGGEALPGAVQVLAAAWPEARIAGLPRADDVVAPNPPLREAAEAFGHVHFALDVNGLFRGFNPFYRFRGKLVPHLSVIAAAMYFGGGSVTASPEGGMELVLGERRLQLDALQMIDYRSSGADIPTYSMSDVLLAGKAAMSGGEPGLDLEAAFKDRVVLVGPTAASIGDHGPTPYTTSEPLVYAHANALRMLVAGEAPHRAPAWLRMMLAVLGALLTALGSAYLKQGRALVVGVALALLAVFGGELVFHVFGIWLDLLRPFWMIMFAFIFTGVYNHFTRDREEKFIRGTFEKYLAPDLIDELIEHPDKVTLGGDKKVLSVLFSDIRGFTSISEKMKPEKLVPFLNEYLSAMSNCILERKGMLDKYIGDAIMAVWGAPLHNYHQAHDACRSALAMSERLAEMAPSWEERGLPPIRAGIGINTGAMVVGNIGSEKKMDFTVIGDHVNLASRLEGLTKQYRVEILISEFTRAKIADAFTVRLLDRVTVKGKEEPIGLYECIAEGAPDEDTRAWIADFERGIELYTKQDWPGARQAIEKVKAARGGEDGPSDVYLERVAILEQEPPGEGWDGVWRWTTK